MVKQYRNFTKNIINKIIGVIMLVDLEENVNLLKALLHSYKIFNDGLLAKSFDYLFLKTTKEFPISRGDLYDRLINQDIK